MILSFSNEFIEFGKQIIFKQKNNINDEKQINSLKKIIKRQDEKIKMLEDKITNILDDIPIFIGHIGLYSSVGKTSCKKSWYFFRKLNNEYYYASHIH